MSILLFCGVDGSHDGNRDWSITIVNNGESCGLFSLLQYSFLFVSQSVRPTVKHFFTTSSFSSYQEVKRVPRPVGSEGKIRVVYAFNGNNTMYFRIDYSLIQIRDGITDVKEAFSIRYYLFSY